MFRLLTCIALLLVAACAQQLPREEPQPQITVKAEEPPPKPVVVPPPVVHTPPPEVAILVSSDIPAYRRVAKAIDERLNERAETWYLGDSGESASKVLDEIRNASRDQVVAVGLDAALASKKLGDKQVVFCQVFNHAEHRLPTTSFKGVSMLPSFEQSFKIWKAISPNLKTIAIVTGPGLDDYVRIANTAAKKSGIKLVHREVTSDKELLVVFKSLANEVEGYWLWPDNRVLSSVVMREVLTFSARSGKQVAVFTDELLALGGLLSITSDYSDIANKVVDRLDSAEHKSSIPGPVIVELDEALVRINPVMVKRFGLNIPEQYRMYLNAP